MRRGRNINSDRNVKNYLTKTLPEQLSRMTLNRANLLAPMPVSVDRLWSALWSDREEAAIRLLLKECPRALDNDWNFAVARHYNLKLERYVVMAINLDGGGLPVARREVNFSLLPDDLQEKMTVWEALRIGFMDQGAALERKVKAMADVCKTYGQVNRLWPELLSFFNEVGQAKVSEARMRSKLHEDCYIWNRVGATDYEDARWENTGKLKEDWLPTSFAKHTELIAECLMLPQAPEDSPRVTLRIVD